MALAPGVTIYVRHSVGDETENRGTWTFDAAGGGPLYPAAGVGIPYNGRMFGYQQGTMNTLRVDPVVLVGVVPCVIQNDYGLGKLRFFSVVTGLELAAGVDISGVQVAWAAVGR